MALIKGPRKRGGGSVMVGFACLGCPNFQYRGKRMQILKKFCTDSGQNFLVASLQLKAIGAILDMSASKRKWVLRVPLPEVH